MVTSAQLLRRFGSPLDDARTTNVNEQTLWERNNLVSIPVPQHLRNACKVLPRVIYAHRVFAQTVIDWLEDLHKNDLLKEINEWNGIFNIRLKRGGTTLSLHAFACAVDCNLKNNPLGLTREQAIKRGLTPFSVEFFNLSRKYFTCGIDFKSRPDGMHFQIKKI